MTDFLDQVVAERRAYVAAARAAVPDDEIRARAQIGPRRPLDGFYQALRHTHPLHLAVIAEVKRVSPASGILVNDFDIVAHAARYVAAGATAISVLTEPRHWGGSLADLVAIRAAVDVPILAKDVVVDPYQIYEARAAGADAVLLIAEALEDDLLRQLVSVAKSLGMLALVEAHEASAFGRAVSSGARVVGVNARNLRNPSEIDVGRVRQLHTFAHGDQILVAESGITSVDDARMLPARVDAVLVGTALMRASDPGSLIHGIASIKRTVHA
jgi:indole-3-glycerol phosphate synthase